MLVSEIKVTDLSFDKNDHDDDETDRKCTAYKYDPN